MAVSMKAVSFRSKFGKLIELQAFTKLLKHGVGADVVAPDEVHDNEEFKL
jgi:hypothetical protein